MSKGIFAVVAVLIIAGIAIAATLQHQSEVELREENGALRKQVVQLPKLTAENQRLSNVVAQARAAVVGADERFQELLKLRAEVTRLTQENQSNRLAQAKLAQNSNDQSVHELTSLRTEITGLRQDISRLREDIRAVPATASSASPAPAEQPTATQTPPVTTETQPLAIRTIETHGETFAEKLKRSVSAQQEETFAEVFGRFLQVNGVDLSTIAGLGYDERTGRVFVRAPQTTLDQIEKLTLALDRAP